MDGHSAMAAMQDGRRSGRFPENDRMASNMLIGIPIRLAIGVLAKRTRNLALQFPLRHH